MVPPLQNSLYKFNSISQNSLYKFNSISMASSSSSKTLILISSDGHEFEVAEGAAVLSITLKNMVEDDCANNPIPIREIDGKTLSKLIVYLRKHGGGDSLSDEEKKAFDKDFLAEEIMGELFDLIQAANYLHIKGLLDIVAQKIANLIKNKSVEWVRDTFGIENDFTPEEEAAVRNEYAWAHQDLDKDN